jgi:integrase/recombinase XerD
MSSISSLEILSLDEISLVVNDLRRRSANRSKSAALNLVLFRLSACCGLRVAELTGLTLANIRVGSAKPHIFVPAEIAKGKKARMVPLWWDAATLADLENWKAKRVKDGARGDDPFLCSTREGIAGRAIGIRTAQSRFDRIIRDALGIERSDDLSIHSGRHSFCSNALAGGKTLVEVRDAAGHADVGTTNIYLHLASQSEELGRIFERPMLAVAG